MNFELDDTERAFRDAVRRYALERLLPDYARWDRGEALPRERIRELADLGLLGIRVPESHGGVGGSFLQAGIASEELARGDHNFSFFIQISCISADLIGQYAQDAVRDMLLPRIASGEAIVAFALTEPGAGSDAAATRTRAVRDGDAWVLNGEKASITFAGYADYAIVFAHLEDGKPLGMGALLVDLDQPGIERQVYDALGGKLGERGSLFFDDIRVPAANQIGASGRGFAQAMEAFDYNRAIIALACIGTAQQSLDETIDFARQRETFGKPLARHAGYAFQVAEHATMLASARLLAYQTLNLRDRAQPHTCEAAMAKFLGPKASTETLRACIVLNGWMGYDNRLPHAQRLRDVLGLEIGDGTPEIMKGVIGRELFGREFVAYR